MATGVDVQRRSNFLGPQLPPQQYGSASASNTGGIAGAYGLHNTAVQQQAGDYDNIMQGYQKLQNNSATASPYNASGARAPAIANLAELTRTGGYTPQGIADIRERSISPIRSIYASANRDVDRQRSLQGGYSPNYNAVKAKMARELSSQIGDASTKVNAELAQNVAQNRISTASPYASVTGQEAGAQDEASRFNRTQIPQQQMQALEGQKSLYGTTPALASTFGNQALNAAQLQNQINQSPAISSSSSSSIRSAYPTQQSNIPQLSSNAAAIAQMRQKQQMTTGTAPMNTRAGW